MKRAHGLVENWAKVLTTMPNVGQDEDFERV